VSGGKLDADADSREAVIDADNDVHGVRYSTARPDDIADDRTLKELERDTARLRQELAASVNPERREEIEQQIRNNQVWRGKLVDKRGKPRPLESPTKEAARKRVRNLLDRARAEISRKMPHLARYLAISEQALEYDPARAIPARAL
jgi:hypothetical protein